MIRDNKGVTLVELLIVIVILGIIAAISVPAVGNIVVNAEKDAVIEDARNVVEAARLACSSEDWDACDDQSGQNTGETFLLANYDPGIPGQTVEKSLSDYLDSEPGQYFAIYTDGDWNVGIDTGEYTVFGNPDSLDRDNVSTSGTLFP